MKYSYFILGEMVEKDSTLNIFEKVENISSNVKHEIYSDINYQTYKIITKRIDNTEIIITLNYSNDPESMVILSMKTNQNIFKRFFSLFKKEDKLTILEKIFKLEYKIYIKKLEDKYPKIYKMLFKKYKNRDNYNKRESYYDLRFKRIIIFNNIIVTLLKQYDPAQYEIICLLDC